MDVLTSNYTPLPENLLISGVSSPDLDLKEITRDIYEKNVELAMSNRIFATIRKVYDIINLSLDVHEASEKLIETIVDELQFQKGFIFLIDKEKSVIKTMAISTTVEMKDEDRESMYIEIPFNTEGNLVATVINSKQRAVSNMLQSILTPAVDSSVASAIQSELKIQTCLIYPLIFAKETLGALVLALDKPIESLSRTERQTLEEIVNIVAIGIERTLLYKDLKAANIRLMELDKLKDEFVSIASHELRTPMTAVKSYLWMALNKSTQPLDSTMKKYLDIAYASTERLLVLVQDMLTVSRIEGNRLEMTYDNCKMYDIAEQVFNELKIKADEDNIQFILEKPSSDMFVYVDKNKIREVLQNLIGNALKFTPKNGKIQISFEQKDDLIYTHIADTGPGISKEDISKLFKKFSKIGTSYTKVAESSGTGLGLWISQQIISLHKGKIEVQSEVGKGSTFTIIIPENKEGVKTGGSTTT
jgi:signal transduction histidine kinase